MTYPDRQRWNDWIDRSKGFPTQDELDEREEAERKNEEEDRKRRED